jgi:hypothetical protein
MPLPPRRKLLCIRKGTAEKHDKDAFVKLFPVHRGKMEPQFGDKNYGIPKTNHGIGQAKGFQL